MKTKIFSVIAAASMALTSFAAFSITASAADYKASALHDRFEAGTAPILVGGTDTIEQDGGSTWSLWTTYQSLLKLSYKTSVNASSNLNYTETENEKKTTVSTLQNGRYKYWKIAASNKHRYDLSRYDYEVTVIPNDPTAPSTAPTTKTVTYKGSAQALVNAGSTPTNGKIEYKVNNGSWSDKIPTATDAGEYTIAYRVAGNANFNTLAPVTITTKAKINKADAAYTTEPAAKSVTWTGEAQELVTEGAVNGGTIQYKLDGGEWSTDIPTATAVGTYTVYYKVEGNANYNGIAEKSVTATIEDKAAEATYAHVDDYTGDQYEGEASAWTVTVEPGSTAIESLDVKVNDQKTSKEGAWTDTVLFGGSVTFGVAVNATADKVTSMTAVVNGADVPATLID